jgi:hypothetical protein
MNLSEVRPMAQSAQPARDLIALALLAPEVARQNLRALLLSNPDYFGKITANSFKAVLKIEKDTTFESIAGISYNTREETLQAIIYLNQSEGYSAAHYGNASQEYVRFYLSYDGGSDWKDQGVHAIKVYDMMGPEPMHFTVSASIHPAQTFCFMQNLPMVRVILSWNSPPPADMPDWVPVWGEVSETTVEIDESSVSTDSFRDKQDDSPLLKTNPKYGETMMYSAILERTVAVSRLNVLGRTELSEHYSVSIPNSHEKAS